MTSHASLFYFFSMMMDSRSFIIFYRWCHRFWPTFGLTCIHLFLYLRIYIEQKHFQTRLKITLMHLFICFCGTFNASDYMKNDYIYIYIYLILFCHFLYLSPIIQKLQIVLRYRLNKKTFLGWDGTMRSILPDFIILPYFACQKLCVLK
jgi:hypothetical protein